MPDFFEDLREKRLRFIREAGERLRQKVLEAQQKVKTLTPSGRLELYRERQARGAPGYPTPLPERQQPPQALLPAGQTPMGPEDWTRLRELPQEPWAVEPRPQPQAEALTAWEIPTATKLAEPIGRALIQPERPINPPGEAKNLWELAQIGLFTPSPTGVISTVLPQIGAAARLARTQMPAVAGRVVPKVAQEAWGLAVSEAGFAALGKPESQALKNLSPEAKATLKSGLQGKLDEASQGAMELQAEHDALQEILATNPAARFSGMARQTKAGGLREPDFITLKQYQDLTGRKIPGAGAKDKQGRIVFEYALDEIASEKYPQAVAEQAGYISPVDMFKAEIIKAKQAKSRLSDLKILTKDANDTADTLQRQIKMLSIPTPEEAAMVAREKAFTAEAAAKRMIPPTPTGMPKAGFQQGALGVPGQAVRPAGRGQIAQISMEDQLKLAKARGEILPVAKAPEVGRPTPPLGVAKEAWQMTREQYIAKAKAQPPSKFFGPWNAEKEVQGLKHHKYSVQLALQQGKPIPPEVLKEYPTLPTGVKPPVPPAPVTPRTTKQPWPTYEKPLTDAEIDELVASVSKKPDLAAQAKPTMPLVKPVEAVAPVAERPRIPQAKAPEVAKPLEYRAEKFAEGLKARSVFEGGEVRPDLEYSWRSMGSVEYNKIISEGAPMGVAQRGRYWSWFPEYSSNLEGKKGQPKFLVEVRVKSEAEGLTRAVTPEDITGVWRSEGKGWVKQSLPAAEKALPKAEAAPPVKPVEAVAPAKAASLRVTQEDLTQYSKDYLAYIRGQAPKPQRPIGVTPEYMQSLEKGLGQFKKPLQPMVEPTVTTPQAVQPPVKPVAAPKPVTVTEPLKVPEVTPEAVTGREAAQAVQAGRGKPPPPSASIPDLTSPPPPPGRFMSNPQDFQEMVNVVFKPDNARKLGNLPIIRNMASILNPAATANLPETQYLVGRQVLFAEVENKAQGVIAHLYSLGKSSNVFGPVNQEGLLTRGALKGYSLHDIAANPNKYPLTLPQKTWVDMLAKISQEPKALLEAYDIPVKTLPFEEGGQYIGRRVFAKVNAEGEILESAFAGPGPGRPGRKLGLEKTRVYSTAGEAITDGYRYLPPEDAAFYNLVGAGRRAIDKQAAEWLLGKIPWRTTGAPEELKIAAEAATYRWGVAKRLQAATNRAIRGERLPETTVNSIQNVYPEQGKALGELLTELKAGRTETAGLVKKLEAETKDILTKARTEYWQSAGIRARAAEKAARTTFEEARLNAPIFQGKILTGERAKQIAETINKGFSPEYNRVLAGFNQYNALQRMLQLAGDASIFGIQLLMNAYYRPKSFGQAFVGFWRGFIDPKFHAKFLSENAATIQKTHNLMLSLRGTEFTEALGAGGLLRKWPLKPLGKALQPFQKGFEAAMDVAGIKNYQALEHLATTSERAAEVEQFANLLRGMTSSARIGVSPLMRQTESFILLAPRYNRAIFAILGDVFRGNIRGAEARKAVGSLIIGMMATYSAIKLVKGEDPREGLLPLRVDANGRLRKNEQFMGWTVADQFMGFGSKTVSLINLLASMTATGIEDPERLMEANMSNPLVRWVRGQLAGAPSDMIDIFTGRNYIGEPTRSDLLTFSREMIAKNLIPIWVASFLMEGGNLAGRAARGAAEFWGGRAHPIDQLRLLSQKMFAKTPEALTPKEMAKVKQTPEWEAYIKQGKMPAEMQISETEAIKDRQNQLARDELVRSGKMPMEQWKDEVRTAEIRRAQRRATIDTLLQRKLQKPKTPEDKALAGYYDLAKKFEGPLFDFKAYNEARDEYMASLSLELANYVEEQLNPRATPLVAEFKGAQRKLRGYWKVREIWLARFPEAAQLIKQADQLEAEGRLASPINIGLINQAKQLRQREGVKRLESAISGARKAWRLENPEGDALLIKFYGLSPLQKLPTKKVRIIGGTQGITGRR